MAQTPPDLKYAKTHEWIRIQDNLGIVGISDHAQHELTDVVFVELPSVGRQVKAGEPVAVVESVKTASDVYSPVSGTILEVNAELAANPGLVNRDPYSGGWFFKLKLSSPAEPASLLSADEYRAQVGG